MGRGVIGLCAVEATGERSPQTARRHRRQRYRTAVRVVIESLLEVGVVLGTVALATLVGDALTRL